MLVHSYYRTAIRHITRNRFFTGLNVVGLSIGIAFFLLIGAYGWSEWRVNRDLKNADRQYFLESDWKDLNMGLSFTTTGQLAPALRQNYPSLVANYYRWDGIECNISVGDKVSRDGVAVADSTLLYMYGFKLLQGDPHSALRDPFTIVLTASKARKYFGRTDVIGKNLTVADFSGGKKDFRITAVMADPPLTWVLLPVFALVLGSLAGLYPAFVLSSRSGVDSLKSRSGMPREHTLLRKGLVSFQFGIAIVALAGALIISEHVQLFFSDQLGYKKEYVVSARLPRDWNLHGVEHIEAVRNVFGMMPGVKEASVSYEIPNGNNGGARAFIPKVVIRAGPSLRLGSPSGSS